jgi:hypothetical protein
MTQDTFEKALQLVRYCGQTRAYLHNFGEPLLHPNLLSFLREAKSVGVSCSFYTNGLLLDREMAVQLVEAGLREISISDHSIGEIARITRLLEEHRIPLRIAETFNPRVATKHNWAGQVRPESRSAPNTLATVGPCIFEKQRAFVILWDGRISTCCIDAEGGAASITVDDLLTFRHTYSFKPIQLCASCTLMRTDEDLT